MAEDICVSVCLAASSVFAAARRADFRARPACKLSRAGPERGSKGNRGRGCTDVALRVRGRRLSRRRRLGPGSCPPRAVLRGIRSARGLRLPAWCAVWSSLFPGPDSVFTRLLATRPGQPGPGRLPPSGTITTAYVYRLGPLSVSRSRCSTGVSSGSLGHGATRTDGTGGWCNDFESTSRARTDVPSWSLTRLGLRIRRPIQETYRADGLLLCLFCFDPQLSLMRMATTIRCECNCRFAVHIGSMRVSAARATVI